MTDIEYHLGGDCELSVDGNPVETAKDVTVNFARNMAPIKNRSTSVEKFLAGQMTCSITFEMDYDHGNAACAALKTAMIAGTAVDVAVANAALDVNGKFLVADFGNSQPLEEGESVSVTLNPFANADDPAFGGGEGGGV